MFSTLYNIIRVSKQLNQIVFEDENVQRFIKQTGLHFDVILIDDFFNDSLFMFAHKFKAPIVTICRCHYTIFFSLYLIFNRKKNTNVKYCNIFFCCASATPSPQLGVYGATEFIDMQHGLLPPPSIVPHYVSITNLI